MQCYICSKPDDLMRSCVNPECTGFAHSECIRNRYLTDKKCGCCNSDIIVHNKTEFDVGGCLMSYIERIYFLFLILCGPASVYLLIVGKTLVTIGRGNPSGSQIISAEVAFFIIYAFVLSMVYMSFFMSFIFENCENRDPNYCPLIRNNLLKTTGVYIILYALVILTHGIGYPIIKYGFGFDEFLTCKTFTAGFVVYLMIATVALISCCSYLFIQCNYKSVIKDFSQTKQEFGVVIEESAETDKLLE